MASISLALLQQVAHGQSQRTILDKSKRTYMSKVKVMTEILNRSPDIRIRTLVVDGDGSAQKHTGEASKILKLRLPISAETGQLLFAAISIDDTLPRRRKGLSLVTTAANSDDGDDSDDGNDGDDDNNARQVSVLVDQSSIMGQKI